MGQVIIPLQYNLHKQLQLKENLNEYKSGENRCEIIMRKWKDLEKNQEDTSTQDIEISNKLSDSNIILKQRMNKDQIAYQDSSQILKGAIKEIS